MNKTSWNNRHNLNNRLRNHFNHEISNAVTRFCTGTVRNSSLTIKCSSKRPWALIYCTLFQNSKLLKLKSDVFSQQGWKKDTPPNPPLEFQPHSKNSEPFTYLIALKPSWTEKTAKENSLLLASSSDGKLSLRPYHPLDEHHPDELFLLTYV